LHPHPPVESATRYVQFIGRDKVLEEGRRAVAAADYRWAVEILHKLVFADPTDTEARELQADAYEQLGYQAEGPQWRGIFLTAARELREGIQPTAFTTASEDTILGMPIDILFDFVAVHVNGPKAADVDIRINLHFTDVDEKWNLWVARGVLNARREYSTDAPLTVSAPKPVLIGVLLKPSIASQVAGSGRITLDGAADQLNALSTVLDDFDPAFPIVTP
jgi:alkyl sulfatase BDS1-like metallo-beta-lactamase superfamily hydrolase